MVEDHIRTKLANLVNLAKRPGTPEEGIAARDAAIRLALKYGLACEFVTVRPSAPPPPRPQKPENQDDVVFYRWIKALASYGWHIHETLNTKIGRQIRFRKPGFHSEIRITQRRNSDGEDFEAEHVMRPDVGSDCKDHSYTAYMTVHLNDLLRHIEYTKDTNTETHPKNSRAWWNSGSQ